MSLLRYRLLRWGVGTLLLLILLLAVGRWGQVYLQSQLQGERGPYLQMPSANGMTIRWQTLAAEGSLVRYGTAADNLGAVAQGAEGRIHEVRLSGLQPDTTYYYSVGETVHSFRTSPLPGAERPVRLWVQGDPGIANASTLRGRDAALQWALEHPREGLPPIDLWLTTGDNAYRSGKDEEFQRHLFAAYPKLLPSVPYLPVYGNHDARRNAFFRLFTFPAEGEAGGVPSGTSHYFSLNYGTVHLLFLDSQEEALEPGSAMLQWLVQDLSVTKQPWLIALMHHPAYSKGSHDSDHDGDSGGRMWRVRENVLPLLEQVGVDLVLFGHSHVYERSHLMACHYGDSGTFRQEMNLQQSDTGDYSKSQARHALGGTIYNVVGSSAHADKGPLDHPAMAVAEQELGSLMIDITPSRLDASFITSEGMVLDHYSIARVANGPQSAAPCAVK